MTSWGVCGENLNYVYDNRVCAILRAKSIRGRVAMGRRLQPNRGETVHSSVEGIAYNKFGDMIGYTETDNYALQKTRTVYTLDYHNNHQISKTTASLYNNSGFTNNDKVVIQSTVGKLDTTSVTKQDIFGNTIQSNFTVHQGGATYYQAETRRAAILSAVSYLVTAYNTWYSGYNHTKGSADSATKNAINNCFRQAANALWNSNLQELRNKAVLFLAMSNDAANMSALDCQRFGESIKAFQRWLLGDTSIKLDGPSLKDAIKTALANGTKQWSDLKAGDCDSQEISGLYKPHNHFKLF